MPTARDRYSGLDLSSKHDLTALVHADVNALGGFDLTARFWLPGESVERRERADKVPYGQWVREGWIEPTDGARIDYDAIRDAVLADHATMPSRLLAFDPQFAAQVANQLDAAGVPIVELPNTFARMNPPSLEFERLIADRKLRHDGNPVLRWCVANVALARNPSGLVMPSKTKSRERIDGVSAAVMAVAASMAAPPAEPESVYKRRGMIVL